MSSLLDLAAKEILRKEIMMLCLKAVPEGCSMDVLKAALSHKGSDDARELERQVGYLELKGMVSTQTVKNRALNISKTIVRITADGIDFLEGNSGQVSGIGV